MFFRVATSIALLSFVFAGCSDDGGLRCGDGTVDRDGVCELPPATDGSVGSDGGSPSADAAPPGDAGTPPSDGGSPPPPLPASADCDEPVSGPVLHVRTDGDDSLCDGSADAPTGGGSLCAFRTIQAAVDAMSAGDTILVHGGTYTDSRSYTDSRYLGSRSGGGAATFRAAVRVTGKGGTSSSARIVIRGAPGETAILDGGGTTEMAFFIDNPDVTVRNLVIRDFRGDPSQDIVFMGISNFFSSPRSEFLCNTVRDDGADAIEDNGGEIAFYHSPEARIEHNDIESGMPIIVAVYGSSCCIHDQDSVIAHNRIIRTRSAAVCSTCRTSRQLFAIGLKRSRRVTISDNFIADHGEPYPTFSAGVYLRDSEDYVVSGNVVEAFHGDAALLWQQDTWGTASRDEANERAEIVNNVFVGTLPNRTGMKLQCSGCVVANNVFSDLSRAIDLNASGRDRLTGTPTLITHNLYAGVATEIESIGSSDYDVRTGNDVHADPAFQASGARPDPYYRPSAGSPLLDAGDDALCRIPMSDGSCDIGAFEP